jgi:hypothetical protein
MTAFEMDWNSRGCEMYVEGMDIKCPVCKTLVPSGQKHKCSQPKLANAPALRGKAARYGN